ncbi:MAG: hypothetical protein MJ105_06605 [Lachnospiraceae bacterium]|nr:hypothetical protein [Lachnospiraceae bacterium]
MNGATLPKFYENHTPPEDYFTDIDPLQPYNPQTGFNLIQMTKYAKSVGKEPNDLSWEELSQFLVFAK